MILRCKEADLVAIFEIVNHAGQAYKELYHKIGSIIFI
jgi:hypothetical protein